MNDTTSVSALLRKVAHAPAVALAPAHVLASGSDVDGYRIVRRLGAGAMGVAYLARDTALERNVAIKVALSRVDEKSDALLRSEARALAALEHPNVVAIYGAGRIADRSYLAMQYVHGGTVRSWLASRPHWRSIAAAFEQACSGLLAAHAAGLVHGDIKPSNLLRRDDGTVLVADFGLAQAVTHTRPAHGGTPAYMAPEVATGGPNTIVADVYAMSVSLAEALSGRRPTSSAHADWKAARPRGVPRRLWRVIRRGCLQDPAQRLSSIVPLQQALRLVRTGPHRRWRLGASAAALTAALASAVLVQHEPCPPPDVEPTLDSQQYANLSADWGRRYPELSDAPLQTLQTLANDFDRQWLATHQEVCRATHVEHRQSERLLDERMACLERSKRVAVRVASSVVSDSSQLSQGVVGFADVPAPAACTGLAAASVQVDDVDEAIVREVEASQADLLLGKAAIVRTRLEPRLRAVEGTPGPTLIHARTLLADAATTVGDHELAREQASRALSDALQIEAWTLARDAAHLMVRIAATTPTTAPQASQWFPLAESLSTKTDADDALWGQLLMHRAHAFYNKSEYEHAGAIYGQAEMRFRLAKRGDLAAKALGKLAVIDRERGDYAAAYDKYEAALQQAESLLGPSHPAVAPLVEGLATMSAELDRSRSATELQQRALSLYRNNLGASSPLAVEALNKLAAFMVGEGHYEEALAVYRDGVEQLAPDFEANHPAIAANLTGNLGSAYLRLRRFEEARTWQLRAVEILERSGADPLKLAIARTNMAGTLDTLGDAEGGARAREQGMAVIRERFDPAHPMMAQFSIVVAEQEMNNGRPDQAQRYLDDGRAAIEKSAALYRARWNLVQARVFDAKKARADARKAARTCADLFGSVAGVHDSPIEACEAIAARNSD